MDVDTRLLRYFVAVVEEGTITGAAERLFISQPALTKQIRQLERHLGVVLFLRSKSGMSVTPAGKTLVSALAGWLDEWDERFRELRTTHSDSAKVLRLGFMSSAANEATQEIVSAFSQRRPGWRVDLHQAAWADATAGLAADEVDVALLRLPFPGQEQMRVQVLLTEPRGVALPNGHRLAARDKISFEDLLDEPFIAAPETTGWWRDYWLAADQRQGRPIRIGFVTDEPDAWLAAIENGYGVALAPESAARYYARPGIAYRPVAGVSPSQVGVAWRPANDTNLVVQDFVHCCVDITAT